MNEYEKCCTPCAVRRKILVRLGMASVWSTPIVQSVLLPTHAQISSRLCVRADVVGGWRMELFGLAASTTEINFFSDGSTDQAFVQAWQFSNSELTMAQGITWLFGGRFNDCDELTGSYINTIVIPPLGNIVIRRGDWIANRLDVNQ